MMLIGQLPGWREANAWRTAHTASVVRPVSVLLRLLPTRALTHRQPINGTRRGVQMGRADLQVDHRLCKTHVAEQQTDRQAVNARRHPDVRALEAVATSVRAEVHSVGQATRAFKFFSRYVLTTRVVSLY